LIQFAFVALKKFSHISLLHVVHHGIMPISVWPGAFILLFIIFGVDFSKGEAAHKVSFVLGARFYPGGHSSFFGLCVSHFILIR